MKKRSILITICTAVLLITACKKETTEPEINPAGYWKGYAFTFHTAILNKDNGTSRLYLRIVGTDTANASAIRDGNFTISGGEFKGTYYDGADTAYSIEADFASHNTLTGIMIFSSTGEAIPFDFRRQP
ncbi:MAG: hypothetical protein WBP16_15190 [Ferruginibacter sp.]